MEKRRHKGFSAVDMHKRPCCFDDIKFIFLIFNFRAPLFKSLQSAKCCISTLIQHLILSMFIDKYFKAERSSSLMEKLQSHIEVSSLYMHGRLHFISKLLTALDINNF